ncbi:GDP-mannose 4,6-dehydratase [Limnobacter humi]|uniref:GDP-mannose 4,6-dehydratase n=1 Tax=Limnobacter humi TaxID=1778671 RepID=A0ABT1WKS4_9BURK|nr:GDP-mannose 4,6-dehydratase [Limnobacter humi]MCQ8897728.1 GDP-mannose 4,6-dehydratase [Limnobacter humi]
MSQKTALILGITGQDGAYLAQHLLSKNYRVVGASRDAQVANLRNLKTLNIQSQVDMASVSISDFRSVYQLLLRVQPDEVYNLAGQTSVGLSFEQPVETLESISVGTLNLLEAIRFTDRPIHFYNAGSSEVFGDTHGVAANENTPFRPRSPYATAKAAAHWQVANYREAYGLKACTGILFNHESPLRPARFVTQKIIAGAVQIAQSGKGRLKLGNIQISRDWGWAPDYVQAMWLMLQQPELDDYVIATGRTVSLTYFIDLAFKAVGLNWQDWVDSDPGLFRPSDLTEGKADPSKAHEQLGWRSTVPIEDIVQRMVQAQRAVAGHDGL